MSKELQGRVSQVMRPVVDVRFVLLRAAALLRGVFAGRVMVWLVMVTPFLDYREQESLISSLHETDS